MTSGYRARTDRGRGAWRSCRSIAAQIKDLEFLVLTAGDDALGILLDGECYSANDVIVRKNAFTLAGLWIPDSPVVTLA